MPKREMSAEIIERAIIFLSENLWFGCSGVIFLIFSLFLALASLSLISLASFFPVLRLNPAKKLGSFRMSSNINFTISSVFFFRSSAERRPHFFNDATNLSNKKPLRMDFPATRPILSVLSPKRMIEKSSKLNSSNNSFVSSGPLGMYILPPFFTLSVDSALSMLLPFRKFNMDKYCLRVVKGLSG
ncbi:MAG: hypothetical protein ACD_67C00081G0001 [uncultured bacterium]|nr:MAG: hypothetical protein ACD_67C00081G0001 [uncultured bacterium]